uniref:Putative secreted protein n=1 Tax=Ixodes ricinus TaxID=34613 RepID=A0A6B0UC93_IXORI
MDHIRAVLHSIFPGVLLEQVCLHQLDGVLGLRHQVLEELDLVLLVEAAHHGAHPQLSILEQQLHHVGAHVARGSRHQHHFFGMVLLGQ